MQYSVKMRAETGGRHISGAERIVSRDAIQDALAHLVRRAMEHPNGEAESVTLTLRKITGDVHVIPPLAVRQPAINSHAEARAALAHELTLLQLDTARIMDLFFSMTAMRGAVLLDCTTLERLEPDPERGVRATCMDYSGNTGERKQHMLEALCLASKVASCPFIIGELCMSDDPGYTTGYFASRQRGYVRIPHVKEAGDPRGGRIFLFSGPRDSVGECISYLESTPVMVAV